MGEPRENPPRIGLPDGRYVLVPEGSLRLPSSRAQPVPGASKPIPVMIDKPSFEPLLQRIADALDRLAPARAPEHDFEAADAFVWHADRQWLEPVPTVNRVEISLLKGIDRVRDILMDNTERFAGGLPANNVLLWGARGMGKSSLVKAVHAAINAQRPRSLVLVEIYREDIPSLPHLLARLRLTKRRC